MIEMSQWFDEKKTRHATCETFSCEKSDPGQTGQQSDPKCYQGVI
jgi:hypothetical protein